MKRYTVYFECYGKKMRTEVSAYDIDDAIRQVKDRIIIHKVTEMQPTIIDIFDQIFKK